VESERFDNLVRGAFEHASRRRVVRVGIGALAASVLTTLGLTLGDVKARKKKKKKKKGVPPATCPADLPVSCGTGCCPNAYPKCCLANFGANGGLIVDSTPGDSTCNPSSFNCCSAAQGGGSCGGQFPQCCPATTQRPFGSCAEATATCCPSTAGGGACEADFPKCCPGGDADELNFFSRCCRATEACCVVTADCPAGQTCSGNCCRVPPALLREARSGDAAVPRAGIPAR
jgi:hypothetical protein